MDIKAVLQEWGLNAIALAAGTIGAFVKITNDENEFSYRKAVAQIVSAIAFSGYGTEFLLTWVHLQNNPSTCGLIGLCLGISGMYAAKFVLKIAKRYEKDPAAFLNKKIKGGSDDAATN